MSTEWKELWARVEEASFSFGRWPGAVTRGWVELPDFQECDEEAAVLDALFDGCCPDCFSADPCECFPPVGIEVVDHCPACSGSAFGCCE